MSVYKIGQCCWAKVDNFINCYRITEKTTCDDVWYGHMVDEKTGLPLVEKPTIKLLCEAVMSHENSGAREMCLAEGRYWNAMAKKMEWDTTTLPAPLAEPVVEPEVEAPPEVKDAV